VSARTFKDVDGVTVTVDVTNTGDVFGQEIIQVYVHDHHSGVVRPEKELKGFAKVALQPGETRSISIPLDFRAFAYYHPKYRQWITESGEFDILIAASATDIRHKLTVTLESTVALPCMLDKESTIREWLADPRGRMVFGSLQAKLEAEAHKMSGDRGEDGGQEGGVGMDIMGMFNDMPLVSVLMFQQDAYDNHPEDIVADLLEQVHRKEA
jgi:beta-glucosidase